MRVSTVPVQMSAQEIFESVDSELCAQSISDDLGRSWGHQKPEKHFRPVEAQPPPRKKESEAAQKAPVPRPPSPAVPRPPTPPGNPTGPRPSTPERQNKRRLRAPERGRVQGTQEEGGTRHHPSPDPAATPLHGMGGHVPAAFAVGPLMKQGCVPRLPVVNAKSWGTSELTAQRGALHVGKKVILEGIVRIMHACSAQKKDIPQRLPKDGMH